MKFNKKILYNFMHSIILAELLAAIQLPRLNISVIPCISSFLKSFINNIAIPKVYTCIQCTIFNISYSLYFIAILYSDS